MVAQITNLYLSSVYLFQTYHFKCKYYVHRFNGNRNSTTLSLYIVKWIWSLLDFFSIYALFCEGGKLFKSCLILTNFVSLILGDFHQLSMSGAFNHIKYTSTRQNALKLS